MQLIFKIGLIVFVSLLTTGITAQNYSVKGQANSWLSVNPENTFRAQGGIRYIPTINYEKKKEDKTIDAEIAYNTYGFSDYALQSINSGSDIRLYRMWLRYSKKQLEIRAGLQKINFGSATLLRPLMWFDKMDPRDPLQLTDGVYGLLFRYYFLNNANIWLWGLYGNEHTKGWEMIPGNSKMPEFGGRLQYPLKKGEIGVSCHNREVDFNNSESYLSWLDIGKKRENRIGIDGKWDVGVGLWFESVLLHQDINIELKPWSKQANIGIDYTFGIGNGLMAISEFLWMDYSEKWNETGVNAGFGALSLSYPMGLMDNISTMVYYDTANKELYRFLNFQRKYDKFSLYVMLFWNPDNFQVFRNIDGNNVFSGKGGQIMLVYNH